MNAPRQQEGLLELDPRARRAWPWLPRRAQIGAWLVGPTGETLRVASGGACDPWPPFGHRSIASDPCAARRAP
jgi:hypothetical protein